MSRRPSFRKKEFFKVYLPDQSSQRMCVPPAFVKLLNGAIPNKAILKDLGGKCWHIEMEEAENGVFFKDGWQRFVSDHSLELGNFLAFTYHGDTSFDVKIFGTNGCKKEEALGDQCINKGPSTNAPIHVKVEKESEEGHTCPMLITGSDEESRRRSSRIIASQTVEQPRAIETSDFSLLKNPHFIAFVCQSRAFRVSFPRKFLAETGIEMDPKMSLRDDHGKLWPISIYRDSDGRVSFGKGWGDFRNHHKLGVPTNNRCAFEFLLRRGRRRVCREIAVHIPHAKGK
ncbi:hypothetical protein RHGRI_029377 [Rhododendron griersonianum]|uniref:TF-B3 domain-containing protein n=1 Tax=Rhododendron griersonianum TaxID=479676 RepID=A0AAV6IJ75_9ERIC|nr:hypothetical protein RHGRI_029377 [Rhododendron griersonianum]